MLHANRRETLGSLLAVGALLPFARAAAAAAEDLSDADILATVDPELREAARRMLGPQGFPPIGADTLAAARAYRMPPGPPLTVKTETKVIPGAPGQPDVTIHIVNPKPAGSRRPALLHTHGGGYILGTAQAALAPLQDYCLALDCPAVTVDYRLAPETRWSGSVADNYAGLKWLHANADAIGADPARIALLGESAGGGHAALLAIAARDRREVPVAFQCLVYPMLDDRTASTRAVPPHVGRLIWTAPSNRFGWASFLGMAPGGSMVPAAAVPARTASLAGLPPTFVGVGDIDLFVDEDIDYARRLIAARVPTELLVVPGAFHGFDALAPGSGPARRFRAAIVAALRRGLA